MNCYRDAVDGRFSGGGTWNEEARRVRLLAAEVGMALDEETLIFYDIRDLMSLHRRLRRALQSRAGRSGAG
ncbi:MAG TPA: hypothetical protein VJY65_11375 [Chloroflexota bacterium]|nr:hypothetical protein [Chloroflexota bacterium]